MTRQFFLCVLLFCLLFGCLPSEQDSEEDVPRPGVPLTPQGPGACGSQEGCPVGSSCARRPDGDLQCMAHCERPGTSCADGTMCLATRQQDTPAICFAPALESAVGSACKAPSDCQEGLLCARRPGHESGECMATCESPGDLCAGGETCLTSSAGALCYLGGEGGAEAACQDSKECGLGLRCVGQSGEGGRCRWACEGDTDCEPEDTCLRAAGEGGGVCVGR